jgi:hypothetical protein
MPPLNRNDLLAARQCARRAWLHGHGIAVPGGAPVLPRADDRDAVRTAARDRFPGGVRIPSPGDQAERLALTAAAMLDPAVPAVYDALFCYGGVEVRAAVLVRVADGFDIVEARGVNSVAESHELELAAVGWVAEQAGVPVRRLRLLHFDPDYVRGETLDPARMLVEVPVAHTDFSADLVALHAAIERADEPAVAPGQHCTHPRPCPWRPRCTDEVGEWSVRQLPRAGRLLQELEEMGVDDVRRIPSHLRMNPSQQHAVWSIVNGREYVGQGLLPALRSVRYPIRFVDFEAAQPAVPRWPGTSPFEQLPTQWSMHVQHADGRLEHREFLHDEDCDPRPAFVESLVAAAGNEGSIVVYSGYEAATLRTLRDRLPDHWHDLEGLVSRVVDLLPPVRDHYYHPALRGSFSIKVLLPALCPEMGWDDLEVQGGDVAARAWLRMIGADTPPAERARLRGALLAYCARDTLAMLRVRDALLARAGG